MKNTDEPTQMPTVTSGRNDLLPKLVIVERIPEDLQASKHRARQVKPKHVKQIQASIRSLGFSQPVLIKDLEIVDGHSRVEAARSLGLETIPCIDIEHLNEDEIRLLRIAVNKLQEGGIWDEPALKLEFEHQLQLSTDISITGFAAWEIDAVLKIGDPPAAVDPADELPELPDPNALAITLPGDLWRLGDHSILCGNARSTDDIELLAHDNPVSIAFTDPPYNVPIGGHVSSCAHHPEFHEASGEMTKDEYEDFLFVSLGPASDRLAKGGLIYVFIDWRHMDEMSAALHRIGLQKIQLCVWTKEYPGMGSFYRSQHELVFVAKMPGAPHCNNIELGAHGRNRINVWAFPGATGGKSDEADDFKVHPTVKPVRLIEEALLDVTGVGDFVLDPFLGSGSTLLAAQRVKRRCLGLEIAPAYVDLAIRRWQDMTGEVAVHVASEMTFADRSNPARHHEDSPDEENF